MISISRDLNSWFSSAWLENLCGHMLGTARDQGGVQRIRGNSCLPAYRPKMGTAGISTDAWLGNMFGSSEHHPVSAKQPCLGTEPIVTMYQQGLLGIPDGTKGNLVDIHDQHQVSREGRHSSSAYLSLCFVHHNNIPNLYKINMLIQNVQILLIWLIIFTIIIISLILLISNRILIA